MADHHSARSHGAVRQRKGLVGVLSAMATSPACRFRHMQIQTDADSDRCRQVQSIELHGDEREQNRQTTADSDIHQIQTGSNKFSRKIQTKVDEEQTTDNSRQSRFRQQADRAVDLDNGFRQQIPMQINQDKTKQNQVKSDIQNQIHNKRNWAKSKYIVDAEMLHITTQDIVGFVKTITSPSSIQNQLANNNPIQTDANTNIPNDTDTDTSRTIGHQNYRS
ncbi:hypothetical protein Tco_1045619 [Tanacetum coccineum]|uniref:Uncharacterized protein n=1 Tax=Tanacetum coccineum TaxID=301880 RepID=A0ABQ5GTV5_9ASTR